MNPAVLAAILCIFCCLLMISVGLGVGLSIRAREQCNDKATFSDLPDSFTMEQKYFPDAGSQATLKVNNNLGTYSTDWALGSRYTYRDSRGNVVAEAVRGYFSRTFEIKRCKDPESYPQYEITQDWFDFGAIEYDLKKNGELIARPSKSTFFTCKPDIVMANLEDQTLATIDRSCGESFILDTWYVNNYSKHPLTNHTDSSSTAVTQAVSDPKLNEEIENYVLGFMAFLTTIDEHKAKNK
jgi:hypothetical protein